MSKKKYKKRYIKILIILTIIFLISVFGMGYVIISDNNEKKEERLSSVEQQIQEEEALKIETKYCDLYYPKKWENNLSIKIKDEDNYLVTFIGQVKDGKENELFSIAFNGKEGYKIGTLISDNDEIDVFLISAELPENLESDKQEILSGMQEDVNYLLKMLEKEKNFEVVN